MLVSGGRLLNSGPTARVLAASAWNPAAAAKSPGWKAESSRNTTASAVRSGAGPITGVSPERFIVSLGEGIPNQWQGSGRVDNAVAVKPVRKEARFAKLHKPAAVAAARHWTLCLNFAWQLAQSSSMRWKMCSAGIVDGSGAASLPGLRPSRLPPIGARSPILMSSVS